MPAADLRSVKRCSCHRLDTCWLLVQWCVHTVAILHFNFDTSQKRLTVTALTCVCVCVCGHTVILSLSVSATAGESCSTYFSLANCVCRVVYFISCSDVQTFLFGLSCSNFDRKCLTNQSFDFFFFSSSHQQFCQYVWTFCIWIEMLELETLVH